MKNGNKELSHPDESSNEDKDKKVPPGAPDRTPVKDPERVEESPKGDPIPPEKKKPRLRGAL